MPKYGVATNIECAFDIYCTETKVAMQKMQSDYVKEMGAILMTGTSDEWKESNLVQNLVANNVLKAYIGTNKNGDEYKRY